MSVKTGIGLFECIEDAQTTRYSLEAQGNVQKPMDILDRLLGTQVNCSDDILMAGRGDADECPSNFIYNTYPGKDQLTCHAIKLVNSQLIKQS